MKIYSGKNVYEAALDRFRWLFSEFPDPIVNVSGGKDSTVVWELAMKVARETGNLPLKTMFIDQEAEWASVIDQIRYMMYHPDVEPFWYQMPIRMSNATSVYENWLYAWDPKEEHRWMREKDPIAIHENHLGVDRFHKIFGHAAEAIHPKGGASLAGLRGEEAPGRQLALTTGLAYKGAAWVGTHNQPGLKGLVFYPIYDWSYTDVWKGIHEFGWKYAKVYDLMYQHGVPVKQMRVSHLHHEEAVGSLFYLQKIEPDTYERLTQRIQGIDTAAKMGGRDYFVSELPYMFRDWKEYRDYLLPKLITNPEWVRKMQTIFTRHDREYAPYLGEDFVCQKHVSMILTNDWEGAKIKQFEIIAKNKLKAMGVFH